MQSWSTYRTCVEQMLASSTRCRTRTSLRKPSSQHQTNSDNSLRSPIDWHCGIYSSRLRSAPATDDLTNTAPAGSLTHTRRQTIQGSMQQRPRSALASLGSKTAVAGAGDKFELLHAFEPHGPGTLHQGVRRPVADLGQQFRIWQRCSQHPHRHPERGR